MLANVYIHILSLCSGSVFIGLLSDLLKVRAIPTTAFLLLSVPVVSARHLAVGSGVIVPVTDVCT